MSIKFDEFRQTPFIYQKNLTKIKTNPPNKSTYPLEMPQNNNYLLKILCIFKIITDNKLFFSIYHNDFAVRF